jgi:hypothetical protein
MAGDLERWEQSPAEMETEFGSYPEEVRQAALEYARGLALAKDEPLPDPGDEDVQFVLVGVRQAGRAILFASSSVTEAKFARKMDGFDRVPIRPGGPVARIPRWSILVGARMTGFEQIVADNFDSALATLVGERQRKARASRRELPGGTG